MYGFKAFLFDGKKTAGKAFDTLEDYTPTYVWIDDVAVISRTALQNDRRCRQHACLSIFYLSKWEEQQ